MKREQFVNGHLGESPGPSCNDEGRALGDQEFQRLRRQAPNPPIRQPAHAYAGPDFELDDVDAVAECDD